MIVLRGYQKKAVEKGLEFFKYGDKKDVPVIVAPTGAGKSIVIAHLAKALGEDVLVFQPSKELLEQNYSKFVAYGGEAKIYSASMKSKEVGAVTFATIGSVDPEVFKHIKYVIIDECHLVPPKCNEYHKKTGELVKYGSMFMQFLGAIPDAKVLGLTATAFRLKKYRHPFSGKTYSQINLLNRERPKFFNSFLHITQIKELYDGGFLCPVKYIELTWREGNLKLNTTGAEFSDESVDYELKQQGIHERLPDIIQQSIDKGRKHRLVFMKNVSDAEKLAGIVPDSVCIHAGTKPKERERILQDFKSGKIKTVFNVSVLGIGFDFPELDTVILARPTMSLSVYYQFIGRGVRMAKGKKDCAVLDMCGNIQRFSKIEDLEYIEVDRKWVLRDSKRVLSGVPLMGRG